MSLGVLTTRRMYSVGKGCEIVNATSNGHAGGWSRLIKASEPECKGGSAVGQIMAVSVVAFSENFWRNVRFSCLTLAPNLFYFLVGLHLCR